MRSGSLTDSDRGVIDDRLRCEMMRYYDERAQEYDELYSGQGPGLRDPRPYRDDVRQIIELVSAFGEGSLVDVGAGTGFWLPYYAPNCSTITLVEQSARMLQECRKRIAGLKLKRMCHLIEGDFFARAIPGSFDSLFAGFFVSHLPPALETRFFNRMRNLLRPSGQFMLIDSVWNEMRRQTSEKEGRVMRRLNDGRTFAIYKKYFDRSEVEEMYRRNDIDLEAFHFGNVFFAAAGRRRSRR